MLMSKLLLFRCWRYEDPVVEEATGVLREWGSIWTQYYVVSEIVFSFYRQSMIFKNKSAVWHYEFVSLTSRDV